MLTRDESENLQRTLPLWKNVIDYWVIGVDVLNTDNSEEIIYNELGHLPGKIVVVNFTGMGPTWTILVEEGIKSFPEATHGIIADADFSPLNNHFDRSQLDPMSSKHLFEMYSDERRNIRTLDWVYRNIPGVKIERRVHQIIKVPKIPGQEQYATWIDLPVEDREGGYMDRTGEKQLRYIYYLELDLQDFPNDTRTLYYLGYAHYEFFFKNQDNPQPEHWEHLAKGVEILEQRSKIPKGNYEERWFSILLRAEIYERFYRNWEEAEKLYKQCHEIDPERADPYFYIGQNYRMAKDYEKAFFYFNKVITLPFPSRNLFNWRRMYDCLRYIEMARVIYHIDVPRRHLTFILERLKEAQNNQICAEDRPGLKEMYGKLKVRTKFMMKLSKVKNSINHFWKKKKKIILPIIGEEIGDKLERRTKRILKVSTCYTFKRERKKYLSLFDNTNADILQDLDETHEDIVDKWEDVLDSLKKVKCKINNK
ncbi:lipopolysaccharide assembly protein b [Anaeramoeba flamelloides]|uniref:Lipopolysaccharide assembly protein b n=1 Tax=Anaeramoeba flamelloides TaxID=1746091 RepID=A0AAV8AKD2_9EUKA|nr:lipopolysaccharide assembly protein b [Anaeramoeba flamelloides]KAJ6248618.1 lipopolysaccharide assembly protein b [Anaeramoeba flamelloides]